MTTTYDRMREIAHCVEMSSDMPIKFAAQLRAAADELESVEREMRAILIVDKWADRIRGEK